MLAAAAPSPDGGLENLLPASHARLNATDDPLLMRLHGVFPRCCCAARRRLAPRRSGCGREHVARAFARSRRAMAASASWRAHGHVHVHVWTVVSM